LSEAKVLVVDARVECIGRAGIIMLGRGIRGINGTPRNDTAVMNQ
jgi:hypothetical protein